MLGVEDFSSLSFSFSGGRCRFFGCDAGVHFQVGGAVVGSPLPEGQELLSELGYHRSSC